MRKGNINKLDIINILIKILLSIVIIVLIFIFISEDFDLSEIYILNRKPIILQTDTMEPVIKEGSMVIVKKAKMDEIKHLDVIAYKLDDRIIIHRAFIDEEGNLKTKADTSNRFDLYTITDDELIGYVSLRINIPIFKFLDHIETDIGISVDEVEI